MARGALPDEHPLCLGMPGMHGNYTAVTVDAEVRPAHRRSVRASTTASPASSTRSRPNAKVIHVDIDPAELGKVRRPDVPIVGDCKIVIDELIKAVKSEHDKHGAPDIVGVAHAAGERGRSSSRSSTQQEDGGPLKPQFCIEMLRENTPDDTILVSGVGQHQMWASQLWKFKHPNTWINSGGLGTMGYAVPAAIGAKVGRPDRMVWAIDGDGCFQMTAQELVTASGRAHPGEDRDPQQRVPRAWCGSGRSSSTRSATARCTCRPTCPTT